MRKSRLRVQGISETSDLKEEIQAILREIVIFRDGGCVLRDYPETGKCGPYMKKGLVLQAEHLNGRSHSISFADTRNLVCLCQRHHIYWKPQNSQRYWEIIEEQIGPKRWDLVQGWIKDRLAHKVDLKMAKIFLEQELKTLKK